MFVSTLGKMFNIFLNPSKSLSDFVERSLATSVKLGAVLPTCGIVPVVSAGEPPNVMCAIVLPEKTGVFLMNSY
jgi:hypothetical protein